MRTFSLKGEWLISHPQNEDMAPGRTIYPEPMRMAEPGWRRSNYDPGEHVVGREGDIEDEQLDHAREWLRHVEAGRIGGKPTS